MSRGSGLHLLLGLLVTEVTVAMGSWRMSKRCSCVYFILFFSLHVAFSPFYSGRLKTHLNLNLLLGPPEAAAAGGGDVRCADAAQTHI